MSGGSGVGEETSRDGTAESEVDSKIPGSDIPDVTIPAKEWDVRELDNSCSSMADSAAGCSETRGWREGSEQVLGFFRTVKDGNKTYSRCVVGDCECRLASQRVSDMKLHLIQTHNMKLQSSAICRLCFEIKNDVIDIFSERPHIASTIRLHFPFEEVTRKSLG